jgi:hypothetical protein
LVCTYDRTGFFSHAVDAAAAGANDLTHCPREELANNLYVDFTASGDVKRVGSDTGGARARTRVTAAGGA